MRQAWKVQAEEIQQARDAKQEELRQSQLLAQEAKDSEWQQLLHDKQTQVLSLTLLVLMSM